MPKSEVRYFNWSGTLARMTDQFALVEVYWGNGVWNEYDTAEFSTAAQSITSKEAEAMKAHRDQARGPPRETSEDQPTDKPP